MISPFCGNSLKTLSDKARGFIQNIRAKLLESWCGDRPFAVLRPLGRLYGRITRLRRRLYGRGILPSVQAARPVVSLGNLTVGGSGKTPVALALAQGLLEKGLRPAILSRGYGRRKGSPSPLVVSKGLSGKDVKLAQGPDESGDEPWLMAKKLPQAAVVVDPKRSRAARLAVEELGADILLLDDGYQHSALRADVRILLLPAEKPFGNGAVLPAGPLREPVSAHAWADIIVATGCGVVPPEILALAGGRPVFAAEYVSLAFVSARDGRALGPEQLAGREIFAFCGLGRPEGFKRSLEKLGARLTAFEALADHQKYDDEILCGLAEKFKSSGAEFIVTTAKDAVKIPPQYFTDLLILEMEMRIRRADEFIEAALKIVKGN